MKQQAQDSAPEKIFLDALAAVQSGRVLLPVVSADVRADGVEYEFPVLRVDSGVFLPVFSDESTFRRIVSDEASYISPGVTDLLRFVGDSAGIVVDPGTDRSVEISRDGLSTLASVTAHEV